MKFKNDNCWILHMGWGNPGCMHKLGSVTLESSPVEKDLGILVDDTLEGPLLISSIQVCTVFLKLCPVYTYYIYVNSSVVFSATFLPPGLELYI